MDPVRLAELARTLSRATNVQQGGYGLYMELEKHIKNELHQGRITFTDLCKVVENLLPANIGSNSFHNELEKFLIVNYTEENLQNIVYLIKGLNLYQIKNEELNALLFQTIDRNIENFSVRQLEILLWSLSRRHLAHH